MKPYVLVFLATAAAAQESINFASLSGRVTDASSGVVQSATVTARQTTTNFTTSTVSDQEGRFRFPYLRPGPYEIRVEHPGFVASVSAITLSVGAAYELPFTLAVTATETTVDVRGDAALLETASSQVAATVPHAEIANLPLNGRSFLDLALLVPGVSPTNTASSQLFAETSAVPGQGISIGSQRNFSNSFIVDGLSANDDAAGLSGIFYGLDTVGQFQVVTSGGQAEFGRALGGYVNVITRSGANDLHGDLYVYFRNQRLNATNALSGNRLPLTQAQYGASLGGPIVHDRTFYFANFEHRALNQSGIIVISPANVTAINQRLDATGYLGPRISTGLYPNPVHNTNFLGKVDHQLTRADVVTLRYSLYDVHSSNSRGVGQLNAVSAAAGLDNTDHTVALGNVLTLSPRLVNETRAQYTRSNLDAQPNDTAGPAVSISGVASFGRLSGSPTARINNLYEIVDNLSWQSGAHAVRVGADFLYNSDTITYPRSNRGSYSFSLLSNFLAGVYNNAGFTQTFGNSVVSQGNANYGVYAQDEWKVAPRFVLNVGLRYDIQLLRTIATDTNNISPRAGFAWSLDRDRRTVIRGSFGLFYDRVPLRAVANAILSSGNTTTLTPASQVSVSLSPAQTGAPVFPNIIGTLPPAVLVNFSTMDRHLQNAYSAQGSVQIERQLTRNTVISAAYEHLRGVHLIMSVNQNVPSCVAAGTNNGCRPNPAFANNSQYSSLGDSEYNALHLSFVQRPTKWGSYRVSYSYSKAFDDEGEFFFSSPIDNFNVWQDWGRSDDDQRHRITVNGTLQNHGFQLSGMLQNYSALPLNILAGANTIQGTAARPTVNGVFIPRNAGEGVSNFTVSARLSRTFQFADRYRLQALIESFNLLNHVNPMTLNATFGSGAYPTAPSPSFRQVTSVADPRTLQLALRLSF